MYNNKNDAILSRDFMRTMEEYVKKIIKSECRFNKTYSGTVVAVAGDNSTASIRLMDADSDMVIPNVKNKSGESLSVGDQIFLEAINNSLNNIVIKYKKWLRGAEKYPFFVFGDGC